MTNPVDDPRPPPGEAPTEAAPISGLSVVLRIAVIFLLVPMLLPLAAKYLF